MSPAYEDSEDDVSAAPVGRRPVGGRQEASPAKKEGPGGTADMYKNFEVSGVCVFVGFFFWLVLVSFDVCACAFKSHVLIKLLFFVLLCVKPQS